MKTLFALASTLLFGTLVFAKSTAGCPNLNGRYRSLDENQAVQIIQKSCTEVRLRWLPTAQNPDQPQSVSLYAVDGQRHQVGQAYSFAYWNNAQLVIEFWSDATGGKKILSTSKWLFENDDHGTTYLTNEIIDARHDEVTGSLSFTRM